MTESLSTVGRIVANSERYRRELDRNPSYDVIDDLYRQKVDWIELMKTLRITLQCDIETAHRLVAKHEAWRRWVEVQINRDPRCRKMALYELRTEGQNGLIAETPEGLKVR